MSPPLPAHYIYDLRFIRRLFDGMAGTYERITVLDGAYESPGNA
jgi:hypothetical protein